MEDKAEALIKEYQEKMDAVTQNLESIKPKTVLVVDFLDKDGIMTPGKMSFQNNLIELSGGQCLR